MAYEKSENREESVSYKRFHWSKMSSSVCIFPANTLQQRDTQFTITQDKEKQKILTIKTQEEEKIWICA